MFWFLLNGSNVSAVYVSMFMPIGRCCCQFWSKKLLSSWAVELQTENCSKNDDFECSAKMGHLYHPVEGSGNIVAVGLERM